MADPSEPRTRAATVSDAAAIAEIYNQGIADRIATFETEPRSPAQIAEWFTERHLIVVAGTERTGPVAFAASVPYSNRPCYSGIGGRGAGRVALSALIEAATERGLHLLSPVFPENAARSMLRL
jgi:L-amino acid N-acyltransferase YncA